MASRKICAVPGCGKRTGGGSYCPMHRARLRRGGSLEPRQPKKTISQLLNGQTKIGEWTILGEGEPYRRPTPDGRPHPHGRQRTAKCRCACGVIRNIPIHTLKQGQSRHCGCRVSGMITVMKTTHGLSHTAEYRIWSKMKGRCLTETNADYPDYDGRGIQLCDEWHHFERFYADMGQRPSPSHSIEREDVNGNYEPANCRWATPREQAQNKRGTVWVTLDGNRLALREACRRLAISYKYVHQRMRRYGDTFEQATARAPNSPTA